MLALLPLLAVFGDFIPTELVLEWVLPSDPVEIGPESDRKGVRRPRPNDADLRRLTETSTELDFDGRAVLTVVVGRDGRVRSVEIVEGRSDEVLLELIRGWTFEPARDVSGKAIASVNTITLDFRDLDAR